MTGLLHFVETVSSSRGGLVVHIFGELVAKVCSNLRRAAAYSEFSPRLGEVARNLTRTMVGQLARATSA
jgi:hypothetical protein